MGETTTLRIGIADMDREIKSKISDHIFYTVSSMDLGSNVSTSDLNGVFDSGLRDDVTAMVKEYYEFLGDIKVELSNSDLTELYKAYI